MAFPLPIKDTPNNNAFKKYFSDIVDGDLFHQRHETENFVFNVIIDHSIQMTKMGYSEYPTTAGIFITHKPTGNVSYRNFDRHNGIAHLHNFLPAIKSGDEQDIVNNPVNIISGLSEASEEISIGDLVSLQIRKGEALSSGESVNVIKKMFMPVEEAKKDPSISALVERIESGLMSREKNLLEASKKTIHAMTNYVNDYRICSSFNRFGVDHLLIFDREGGHDISESYRKEYFPPYFFGVDAVGGHSEEILSEFNERRYGKFKKVLNDIRKEALLLSSLESIPQGMSETEVRESIDKIYPDLQHACDRHQEGWNHFLGKSYQQIRNRAQILEGPLKDSVTGLSMLLKNDGFRSAIDNGESLKGPMEDLPLFNTSKRTVMNFLNNVSGIDEGNNKGAIFMRTEKGEVRSGHVRRGAALSSSPSLSTIATIQSIPSKYFNYDGHHLRNVYNMPYIDLALPSAINKVKEGEWKSPQAFQWIQRLGDHAEANRLSNEVGDTERIVEQFYINTLSSHIIYHAGLDLRHVEDIRYRESPVAEKLMKSMATTMPYSAILNLSSEVHRRSQELMKTGKPEGSVSWDPAIENDFTQDDITITPIHSTIEMTLEGAELDHCVGTYIRPAMEGETFIFGVRDAEGRRLSTIEIGLDENEEFEIQQHFAVSNSEPKAKEKVVAETFLKKLNAEDIDFNFDTNVSQSDLNKLLPIQRAEVEHGVRFSDTEVAMDALHHLKAMMPFSDPLQIIKDDLMTLRSIFHDREYIEDAVERLDALYDQQRAMGAYNPS